MSIQIGNWVRRPGKGSKWHLTDSVIEDRAITRCGREMERKNRGGELQVSALMPLTRMIGQPQLCKAGCEARDTRWLPAPDVGTPEDDGSTAPVEDTPA